MPDSSEQNYYYFYPFIWLNCKNPLCRILNRKLFVKLFLIKLERKNNNAVSDSHHFDLDSVCIRKVTKPSPDQSQTDVDLDDHLEEKCLSFPKIYFLFLSLLVVSVLCVLNIWQHCDRMNCIWENRATTVFYFYKLYLLVKTRELKPGHTTNENKQEIIH